jgi:molybdenum cofactor cytidylyltransferase
MPATSLCDAVLPERAGLVAFVGAGGKTTAILRLAAELAALGRRAVATTTTRVGSSMSSALPVVDATEGNVAAKLERALVERGGAFLTGGRGADGKFVGVESRLLEGLVAARPADAFLVEADGSKGRALKAPAEHEPVIPATASLVVPVVGLDALGKPLDETVAHRPELVSMLHPGDFVTPELIATLMVSERGGLKGVPPRAAVRPLLNRARGTDRTVAIDLARSILVGARGRVNRVVVSDIPADQFSFFECRQNRRA